MDTDEAPPPESYWAWWFGRQGPGFTRTIGFVAAGLIAGLVVGYALGALVGVLFDVSVVRPFAAGGALLGSAEGVRLLRHVDRGGDPVDPYG